MYNGKRGRRESEKERVLIRDGLSRYPGCQLNPIWTKLGSNNWHGVDDSAYGYGRSSFLFPGMHAHLFTNSWLHPKFFYNIQPTSMWCSCFISLETEIVIFTIKEGDNLVLPCASWKKCYNGYRPKNHFFYQFPSKRACSPTNCRDYPSRSGIIDYERNFFGVMIMNISRDHSGLWICRIKDNETKNLIDLRLFRVEVTNILGPF